jgi:hypothetical protein
MYASFFLVFHRNVKPPGRLQIFQRRAIDTHKDLFGRSYFGNMECRFLKKNQSIYIYIHIYIYIYIYIYIWQYLFYRQFFFNLRAITMLGIFAFAPMQIGQLQISAFPKNIFFLKNTNFFQK